MNRPSNITIATVMGVYFAWRLYPAAALTVSVNFMVCALRVPKAYIQSASSQSDQLWDIDIHRICNCHDILGCDDTFVNLFTMTTSFHFVRGLLMSRSINDAFCNRF